MIRVFFVAHSRLDSYLPWSLWEEGRREFILNQDPHWRPPPHYNPKLGACARDVIIPSPSHPTPLQNENDLGTGNIHFQRLFQLDDSKSLYDKWVFHRFHRLNNCCLGCRVPWTPQNPSTSASFGGAQSDIVRKMSKTGGDRFTKLFPPQVW